MSKFETPMTNGLLLFFDTETTGLLPKGFVSLETLDKLEKLEPIMPPIIPPIMPPIIPPIVPTTLPYITQLSAILYSTKQRKIVSTLNCIIRIPPHVEISDEVTALTGIDHAKCDQGVSSKDALTEFIKMYSSAEEIIAHNLDFDRRMIKLELARIASADPTFVAEYPPWTTMFDDKKTCCTMRWGRNICKIERIDRHGKPYFKSPKLSELYEHLFQEPPPTGLHNALVDTLVCLRCYVKLRFRFDLRMDTYEAILSASLEHGIGI